MSKVIWLTKKISCRHPNCIRNEKYVTNIIDVQLRPFSCEQNVQQSASKRWLLKVKSIMSSKNLVS